MCTARMLYGVCHGIMASPPRPPLGFHRKQPCNHATPHVSKNAYHGEAEDANTNEAQHSLARLCCCQLGLLGLACHTKRALMTTRHGDDGEGAAGGWHGERRCLLQGNGA